MTLHDAAEELFDIRDVCEGFDDMTETWKAQAVLKQLSVKAGEQIQIWYIRQHVLPFDDGAEYDDHPIEIAALTWRDARIDDCLAEATRIAETIEEG